MPNLPPFLKSTYLTYTCWCFLVVSCQNKTPTQKPQESVKTDSIQTWIDQSKLDETSQLVKTSLLKKATEETKALSNDSLKAKYFTQLSAEYLDFRDSINFRKVNKEAFRFTQSISDSANLASSYKNLGTFLSQHSIQDSAYFNYRKAKLLFEVIDDPYNLALVLHNIGRVQAYMGDNIRAESSILEAIGKLKPLDKFEDLSRCYSELADNAKLLDQPEKALEDYKRSLIYLEKAKASPIKILRAKHNIALVHQKQGLHEKAIPVFLEVLSFDNLKQKQPRVYGRVLNNLGFSYLKNGQFTNLPEPFIVARKLQDSLNDIGGKASSTMKLAEYYLAVHDSANTLINLKAAKELATETRSAKNVLNILKLLARVDHKNTLKHFESFIALSDSLQKEERKIREKFGRIQFETDEAIAENEQLAREKQLWNGIAVALILLGLASFIIINQRVKNRILKFRQQQQVNNQEIFNLMLAQGEKVEEGKKMEQKRVSEELHDGVLGKMLGARMMLIGLNKRTGQEAIDERAKAISILQNVEGEVRSISHELSHSAYQKIHNFILSIKDLVQSVESASKINIDFKFTDELDWDALSGEIKINLYRMVQESLQNSVKHASCKNIFMDFHANESLLTVDIADDGKGFIQKRGKKGIGMRNMASRIKKINGNWDIKSEVGKGTKVTFIIPLVSNVSENAPSISPRKHNLQET